jgi:hypothetical protein
MVGKEEGRWAIEGLGITTGTGVARASVPGKLKRGVYLVEHEM